MRGGTGVFDVYVGVVKKHHRAVGQFGQPCVEIVAYRIKGVGAVDMQQINRIVCKRFCRLVEILSNQCRYVRVVRGDVARNFLEQFFIEMAHVNITFPQVDSVALGIRTARLDGLAESRKRRTAVGAEFDDSCGALSADQLKSKRYMSNPPRGFEQFW